MDNDLLIGVTRSFRTFSEALDEVKNARIFAGIHFRSACNDGQTIAEAAHGRAPSSLLVLTKRLTEARTKHWLLPGSQILRAV